jgi:hypothetical protein
VRCIFCDGLRRPTDEDALPAWAVRTFDIRTPITTRTVEVPGVEPQVVGEALPALEVTLSNALCAPCNNGWLGGKVEGPASALMKAMIIGKERAVLNPDDQKLLGLWAVKTVLLERALRQIHPGGRAIEGYWASDVELAYMWRHNAPPPRSMVWIGAYDCENQKPLIYHPSSAVLPTRDGARVEGHFTTFTMGYVAFQVFSVDFLAAEQHGADVWNTQLPADLAAHLVRVWPQQLLGREITWPSARIFAPSEWQRLVTWDGQLRLSGEVNS